MEGEDFLNVYMGSSREALLGYPLRILYIV